MMGRRLRWIIAVLPVCVLVLAGCSKDRSGQVLDEASRAGRTAASFPAAEEDYFHDMDSGQPLTREEIQGRNTWMVWTGGNDRFWDIDHRQQLRQLRSPQDRVLPRLPQVQPGQSLELSRAGQRALLREAHRSRSPALRPVARQALARAARLIRSRTTRSIPEWPSGPGARIFPWDPSTATPRGSSACACSPTPPSTRRRPRSGTRRSTTTTRSTTCPRTSSVPIAWACRAPSATWGRTP